MVRDDDVTAVLSNCHLYPGAVPFDVIARDLPPGWIEGYKERYQRENDSNSSILSPSCDQISDNEVDVQDGQKNTRDHDPHKVSGYLMTASLYDSNGFHHQ
jgi:hypothetical protein